MWKRHLANLIGKTTDRHLLAFFVDDYGAIINDSVSAQQHIARGGFNVERSRFTRFDALEDNDDMDALFGVLTSFRDIRGNHVAWTPLAVAVNPDFGKIRESGYSKYYYELLTETLHRLSGYDQVSQYIEEGIRSNIFVPQFHGREHLNVKFLMNSLRNENKDARVPFDNNSLYTFRGPNGVSSNAAFRFDDEKELEQHAAILTDGLERFEEVYGYRAIHFNAPGERESRKLHDALKASGIRYIETDRVKQEPLGYGQFAKHFQRNGARNTNGQRYIIRNCVFEPTAPLAGDWIEYTFGQIDIAFKWRKPAIVSAHRVNFAGHISEENRRVGLRALAALISKVQRKYPDVEFVSSRDLFKAMYE